MRLGIMQPYFFPYLGHFALIARCDTWVVFDITQYNRRTYMSRNEVLKSSGGRQFIRADIANGSMCFNINQVLLKDPENARKQVLGSLSHYKNKAPYYKNVIRVVEDTFNMLAVSQHPLSLVHLNICGLCVVCKYLGLDFNYLVASELEIEFTDFMLPGDWAPQISSFLGAKSYLNPMGGREIFDSAKFEELGVDLEFLSYETIVYDVFGYSFEPNLSVIDALMWVSPSSINKKLKSSSSVVSMS